jgi:thiamine-monophosphate kinase
MAEFDLIARYFAPLATHPGAAGLKDDVALIAPPEGRQWVITMDSITEGVHFFGTEAPSLIARKLLRTNLSDLAAKGAVPYGYLLSVAAPPATGEAWFAGFADGLRQDQTQYGLSLLGGDTVSTRGGLTLTLTALGTVPATACLPRRNGAKAGDVILVTGTLGDAALGLLAMQEKLPTLSEGHTHWLRERYLLPQPRLLPEGAFPPVHAAMDISDGLAQDLSHICQQSGLQAEVTVESLPLSLAAQAALEQDFELFSYVVSGGDDYEILCTCSAENVQKVISAFQKASIDCCPIGTLKPNLNVNSDAVIFNNLQEGRIHIAKKGFEHFVDN